MEYAAEMGSRAVIYVPSFIKIGSGIQKWVSGGFTDTQTAWRSHKYTLDKKFWEILIAYFPWYNTDRIENNGSNNSSIVACVFVTAFKFLKSRCLATIGGFLQNQAVTYHR
jgi:hypothetical protein